MAKDDYDYLVFKILTYLYGCFKRKISFSEEGFRGRISEDVAEETLTDTLRFMQEEGMVNGLSFVRVWGNEYVLTSGLREMSITPFGIRHLLDNDKMRTVKKMVLEGAPSAFLELVKLVMA